MPVYKNEIDGSIVLHFGLGDIAVCRGRANDSIKPLDDEVLFIAVDAGPVGKDSGLAGRSTEEVGCAARMVFDSLESLDVVISTLTKLGEDMREAFQ